MQAVPLIPDPVLRSVRNETGYALFQCDKMGPGRKFHDTLVVKAAFALTDGVLEPLDVRAPIHLSDTYWGPGPAARSSIRDPGDALFHKPGTDVIVTGTARAPGAWRCGSGRWRSSCDRPRARSCATRSWRAGRGAGSTRVRSAAGA
ncbi:MAG: DUF2169 domain-containing protein [Sandaracinaceae bacterium]|nr:DUF2169 domain-containing protein [Sandaracinaceae bacterium]